MLHSVELSRDPWRDAPVTWDEAEAILSRAAQGLVAAEGAELLIICTNTMHKLATRLTPPAIPLLHIAIPTAEAIEQAGLRKVGLLGTQFTMEQPFYRELLQTRYGLEVLIPTAVERAEVHRVIFEELCVGVVRDDSRQRYQQIMANLVARGARGSLFSVARKLPCW